VCLQAHDGFDSIKWESDDGIIIAKMVVPAELLVLACALMLGLAAIVAYKVVHDKDVRGGWRLGAMGRYMRVVEMQPIVSGSGHGNNGNNNSRINTHDHVSSNGNGEYTQQLTHSQPHVPGGTGASAGTAGSGAGSNSPYNPNAGAYHSYHSQLSQ
jgi:hypothetical protein